MRRIAGTGVVMAAALTLAACGSGSGGSSGDDSGSTDSTSTTTVTPSASGSSSDGSDASTSTSTVTAGETSDGSGGAGSGGSPDDGGGSGGEIAQVDLGNRAWEDGVSFRGTFDLVDGETTYGDFGGRVHLDNADTTYTDVDGDGHDDALITLTFDEGNGTERSLYVWLWDPAAQDARQVLPALATDLRCGDVTEEISVVEPGVVGISRLVREGEACSQTPTSSEQVTVAVDGRYAWQTSPTISALQCPYVEGQGLNSPGSDLGDDGPRPWPADDAPVMLTGGDIQALDITPDGQSIVDGWNQLMYVQDSSDKGGVPPCGYLPVPG